MQSTQMIFYFEDPIAFLNTQFRERQKKNPKFSLRAWARQMGYQNPSLLFQVLKGERRLKMDLAMKIASNLGLKGRALRYFELIVLNGVSQSDTEKRVFETMLNKLRPKKFRNNQLLSMEIFQTASEWYHWAILAMTKLDDFEADVTWIQSRLGHDLDKKTIREAIDRLIKVGLLRETEDGKFEAVADETTALYAKSAIPSEAIREFHTQMIEKAHEAVKTQTREERLLSGGTFTFSKSLLPQVEEILLEAQQQIFDLGENAPHDEVYQLNMQFFRITKKKPETSH